MWSYKDGALPNNTIYKNDTHLTINNIVKANEGNYECQGVTELNERFHGKIQVFVRSKF